MSLSPTSTKILLIAILTACCIFIISRKVATSHSMEDEEATPHPTTIMNKQRDKDSDEHHEHNHHQNQKSKFTSESARSSTWKPITCMPGTLLNSPKLKKNCAKSNIVPTDNFCSKNHETSSSTPICGQYSGGRFSPSLSVSSPHDESSSNCKRETHLEDKISNANWFFEKENDLLKSRNCDFEYLKPNQIYSKIMKKMLSRQKSSSSSSLQPIMLFSGDSMTRQLVIRLISLLRGQLEEPISEHYFHFDAAYFIIDGKYDVLLPLGLSPKLSVEAVPKPIRKIVAKQLVKLGILDDGKKKGGSSIIEALLKSVEDEENTSDEEEILREKEHDEVLTIVYHWDPRPSKFRSDFKTLRPVIHVASWMYWWQKKDPLTDFDRYAEEMNSYHDELRRDLKKKVGEATYIYITTPWTREGVFGGVDDAIRFKRNKKAIDWLRGESTASTKGTSSNVKRLLVDYSAIAGLKKMGKTRDEIHYMCIWQPKLPGVVTEQKFVSENGCVEKMNAAVAMMLLHTLE